MRHLRASAISVTATLGAMLLIGCGPGATTTTQKTTTTTTTAPILPPPVTTSQTTTSTTSGPSGTVEKRTTKIYPTTPTYSDPTYSQLPYPPSP
jgi:hypothetical protein